MSLCNLDSEEERERHESHVWGQLQKPFLTLKRLPHKTTAFPLRPFRCTLYEELLAFLKKKKKRRLPSPLVSTGIAFCSSLLLDRFFFSFFQHKKRKTRVARTRTQTKWTTTAKQNTQQHKHKPDSGRVTPLHHFCRLPSPKEKGKTPAFSSSHRYIYIYIYIYADSPLLYNCVRNT